MKYLADTDVLIDHLRGKKKLDPTLLEGGVSISIITYGELLYGAEKSANKEKAKRTVLDFIENLSIKIANLSEEIMQKYATIKTGLEKKGQKLDDFDLLIASTAMSGSLVLLTRNIKHFSRIKKLLNKDSLKLDSL